MDRREHYLKTGKLDFSLPKAERHVVTLEGAFNFTTEQIMPFIEYELSALAEVGEIWGNYYWEKELCTRGFTSSHYGGRTVWEKTYGDNIEGFAVPLYRRPQPILKGWAGNNILQMKPGEYVMERRLDKVNFIEYRQVGERDRNLVRDYRHFTIHKPREILYSTEKKVEDN